MSSLHINKNNQLLQFSSLLPNKKKKMSTQLDHENEAFLWETLDQAWANLSENSSDDKVAGRKHEAEGSEKGKKRVRGIARKGKEKKEKEGTSDHDMHIWTERERRKKMRNMFSNLHALIPHLPPKVRT